MEKTKLINNEYEDSQRTEYKISQLAEYKDSRWIEYEKQELIRKRLRMDDLARKQGVQGNRS